MPGTKGWRIRRCGGLDRIRDVAGLLEVDHQDYAVQWLKPTEQD